MWRKTAIIVLACVMVGCKTNPPEKTISVGKRVDGHAITSVSLEQAVSFGKNYFDLIASLHLQDLLTNHDSIHFRFWNYMGQVTDVWTRDLKTFHASVTQYARSDDWISHGDYAQKTFIKTVQKDTATARRAYNILRSILSVPTMDSIKDWGPGFDGVTYTFEISTPNRLNIKIYWSPCIYYKGPEAKQVAKIILSLDKELGYKEDFEQFYDLLPQGKYLLELSHLAGFTKLSKPELQEFGIKECEEKSKNLKKQRRFFDELIEQTRVDST